jgi:hypothetical protein
VFHVFLSDRVIKSAPDETLACKQSVFWILYGLKKHTRLEIEQQNKIVALCAKDDLGLLSAAELWVEKEQDALSHQARRG